MKIKMALIQEDQFWFTSKPVIKADELLRNILSTSYSWLYKKPLLNSQWNTKINTNIHMDVEASPRVFPTLVLLGVDKLPP